MLTQPTYPFPIFCQVMVPVVITFAMLASSANSVADETNATGNDGGKVRVLMITGGCCHDYQNQKQIISEGLSASVGPIEWTILQYGDKKDIKAEIYQNGNWIDGYDVVVHNECFGAVEDEAFVQGIVDAHKRTGIPAIMVHCSMHSYRNAPNADAWRELLGVKSVRHEKAKRSLVVKPSDADSAIAKKVASQLGDSWNTPNGELYLVEKTWPGVSVLATAYSDETESDQPVIWTNQVDEVRVFSTSLGHHNETMQSETWQSILSAGFDWCLQRSDL